MPTESEIEASIRVAGFTPRDTVIDILEAAEQVRADAPLPQVPKMRGALERISKQKLTSELTTDETESADFEGAYDIIIKIAREAIGIHG